MEKMYCKCPHILCSVHGNCRKCIEKNIEEKSVCYCMEHNAELLGAKLPGKFPVTEIYDSEKEYVSALCGAGEGDSGKETRCTSLFSRWNDSCENL